LSELWADNAHLYIYGTGPKEHYLKRLSVHLGIETKVSFMGWVDAEKIWPNVDLLLIPSLHEGASNALLEALAHRIPILASDIPAHREMLVEDELLSLEDMSAWQSRIKAILAEPDDELRSLADKQQLASQWMYFDWNKAICECIVCWRVSAAMSLTGAEPA
jgi:glycosyltransferase involved in cell wall biosynthesis